jgi:hypothetical protein
MGDVTKATAGIASDRRARAKYCFIIEHDEIKAKVENEVLFDS